MIGPDDESWIQRGLKLVTSALDRRLAEIPALLSVSTLKELAVSHGDEETPLSIGDRSVELRLPEFATTGTPAGHLIGTACHRFLEHADPGRLASETQVREQLRELVTAGVLTADEADLIPVADLAWFGNTDLAQALARHEDRVQREVPFVCALPCEDTHEAIIVRGVIDCLWESNHGLTIIDYKTDRIDTAEELQQRLTGYTIQMQLYAQALGQLRTRPVTKLLLVFLRGRRIIDVPHSPFDLQQILTNALGS